MRLQVDDVVRCISNHYKSYSRGQCAVVRDIPVDKPHLIILDNDLSDYGTSHYDPAFWEFVRRPSKKATKQTVEEDIPLAQTTNYQRTKFFAVQLKNADENRFIDLDVEHQTVARDTKSEVLEDIRDSIAEGQQWLILQTVALVKPKDTRPPLQVTEYK